ncbi:hypothetical protein P154DRAFT_526279 [Amniculicola lignicola CBS 123094]|uniref:5'-3' DNA helicase ZGRF1-like N-terminal domain-containing protein n=1 Tax=Amniculicola lignicola CBS 123094 TaxID=1392246 RepID=A0A6A5W5T2_9PLEO|nr:hypothetical protein P154DRAFT_526279 [Amniculicola lignicola CBS 123094]
MATPARSMSRPSALAASQNTAPVIEFRCLFTHDMRRKQKRWQDGFVKFHTFNSRIMAYNTSRDVVGDTYWKESNELQEGDELTLDRAGVLVEVTERMGTSQTDLTPIFESRKTNASPQANTAAPASRPYSKPPTALHNASRTGSQLRHKSLNALLGTPRGPLGKAAPRQSPYETRQEKENGWGEERATKRQKVAPATELLSSSPVKSGKNAPNKDVSQWAGASGAKRILQPPRAIPRAAPIINLDSEPDLIASSDVTLPSPTPGMQKKTARVNVTLAPLGRPSRPTMMEPPPVEKPRLPKGRVSIPGKHARPAPPPLVSSSPPVITSNTIHDVDVALPPKKKPKKDPPRPESPPRDPRAKALRLTTSSRRGMLLCQTLPQQPARFRDTTPKVQAPKRKKQVVAVEEDFDEPLPWPSEDEDPVIENRPIVSKTRNDTPLVAIGNPLIRKRKTTEPSPPSSPDAFEDIDVIYGLMDRQIIVSSDSHSSDKPLKPKTPKTTKSKPSAVKKAEKQQPTKNDQGHAVSKRKTPAVKTAAKPIPLTTKATSPVIVPASKAVKTKTTLPEPSKLPSPETEPFREISPLSNPSAPPTKPLISTGGFKKKTKTKRPSEPSPAAPLRPNPTASKPTPQPIIAAPPPPKPAGSALPPHPLRANRSGPLMTTTELSALLQKPPKRMRIEDDPIEDASQQHGISPNRSFRRVRSENDAPIPSTSEAWEQRNLANGGRGDGNGNGGAVDGAVAGSVAAIPISISSGEKEGENGLVKGVVKPKGSGLAALVKKTDPRKKFLRSASLSGGVEATGGVGVDGDVDDEIVMPPVDTDVGPWSTEAFDLFGWRPPGRDGAAVGDGEGEDRGIGLLEDKQ